MTPAPRDRKPLSVMIALAGKGKKGSDEAESDTEDEHEGYEPDEGELRACQDVIDAIQKRSAESLSEALHNWMELAGYGRHEGEEE